MPSSAADAILKMRTNYSTCASYTGSGTVYRSTDVSDRSSLGRVSYRTAFLRPLLRVDIVETFFGSDEDFRAVIWNNRDRSYIWSSSEPRHIKDWPALESFTVGATLSGRVSNVLRELLMPDLSRNSIFPENESFDLIEDDLVDGVDCVVVDTGHKERRQLRAWIDKRSFLLTQLLLIERCHVSPSSDLDMVLKRESFEQSPEVVSVRHMITLSGTRDLEIDASTFEIRLTEGGIGPDL